MEMQEAVKRVQLGESLQQLAESRREELLSDCGLTLEEARPSTFRKEAEQWICKLARHLGDRHSGDRRVAEELAAWTLKVDDYDVFDALLANFGEFEGRDQILRRGLVLFPGTMTSHWTEERY